MNNITFVIFTYNEEKRIEYVVRNFVKYGEVLVLDDGSTDRTKEIVEGMGVNIILRPKINETYVETEEMYNFVKKHVKTDWIYWGCTDNLLPKDLLTKLIEISKQDKIKYVSIPLYTYLWGNTKTPMLKSRSPRFFMKDYIDFSDNKIHGMGRFIGNKNEILNLPNGEKYAIHHYSLYNLNKFIFAHLKYAETEAQQRFKSGKRFSFFYMIGGMIRYFILFFKEGFRNGKSGFITSLLYAFFRMMVSVRLYEIENNITLESIEEKYSKAKEELLKNLK